MRAAVYAGPAEHQRAHSHAMATGLRRHGIEVEFFTQLDTAGKADFYCTWGWRNGKRIHDAGGRVLVMERGYLGDRFTWTSLGWNGLNGRATFHTDGRGSERFDKHFAQFVKPWRDDGQGYALIVGQVPGDMSIAHLDAREWYREAAHTMLGRGYQPKFRPHPQAVAKGLSSGDLPSYRLGGGTLQEALEGAAVVVTMNSNTGVDAVLAGVPTIVCDRGAMAGPVAAYGLDAELVTPDRTEWFSRLAWTQFTLDEIESGFAWECAGAAFYATEALDYATNAPKRETALVLGGGNTVWADVEAALDLGEYDGVFACNDIGAAWAGKLDAWVTLHPDKFETWKKARAASGFAPALSHVSYKAHPSVDAIHDYRFPGVTLSGSSGLFAAKVALDLGFKRLVLCGVPMDAESAHFNDAKPWDAFSGYRHAWICSRKHIAECVRSMSGWTAEFVGRPSASWLAGDV